MSGRIGFCCKFDGLDKVQTKLYNQGSTTLAYVKRQSNTDAYKKIYSLVEENCNVLWRQLAWIKAAPQALKLFRITSDFLPLYTHESVKWIYQDSALFSMLESKLAGVREYADAAGIRLCTHPGQFTTLCSLNQTTVDNSIEDLEYHGLLARLMGYGDTWHSSGYAINIHANNNLDPDLAQFKSVFSKLSPTVRNLLTVENDEFGCDLDGLISANIQDTLPIVLDIHHHWIASGGEYIQPSDSRIDVIKSSWRDVRPLGHYSTSSESLLEGHSTTVSPDYTLLGIKPGKLRSHSYDCWNQANNSWALEHLKWMDIEVEAKGKQIAAKTLADQLKSC